MYFTYSWHEFKDEVEVLPRLFLFYPPIWVVLLSIFHIFSKKTAGLHIVIGEIFLIIASVISLYIFMNTCDGESCIGGPLILSLAFGALLINPFVQLMIFFIKKRYLKDRVVEDEGMLPREIKIK